jgi:hypothetical protein
MGNEIYKKIEVILENCHFVANAYLSLEISAESIVNLNERINDLSTTIKSALFHQAVIKYALPFTETRTKNGKRMYAIKKMQDKPEFSTEIHKDLLEIRHKLIAHHDLEVIKPRIIWRSLNLQDTSPSVIVEMAISTKTLAHPTGKDDLERFSKHINFVKQEILSDLKDALIEYRAIANEFPSENQKFEKFKETHFSNLNIPDHGPGLELPHANFNNHNWMNVAIPDFKSLQSEFACFQVFKQLNFYENAMHKLGENFYLQIETQH